MREHAAFHPTERPHAYAWRFSKPARRAASATDYGLLPLPAPINL